MDQLYTIYLSTYTYYCTGFFLGINYLHDHCRSAWVGKELTSNFPTPESLGPPVSDEWWRAHRGDLLGGSSQDLDTWWSDGPPI